MRTAALVIFSLSAISESECPSMVSRMTAWVSHFCSSRISSTTLTKRSMSDSSAR
ncbi:hypothetical protein ACE1OC_00110 [Streptomyces sp. DSM 116496]|uniref:hypothetical protein n=1 Tax=Streptomyces stoeckheimensis TaxID=3344656 RepID=UPI0038B3AEA2